MVDNEIDQRTILMTGLEIGDKRCDSCRRGAKLRQGGVLLRLNNGWRGWGKRQVLIEWLDEGFLWF